MTTHRGQTYGLLATPQISQKIRQVEQEDAAEMSDEAFESLQPANIKGKAPALGQIPTPDEPQLSDWNQDDPLQQLSWR